MNKITLNKSTGLDCLIIGKQKFDADSSGIFKMALEDVTKILIDELPINRECLICNDDIDLIFVRRNAGVVEIVNTEDLHSDLWNLAITTGFYFNLKELQVSNSKSFNPKIIKNEHCGRDEYKFEFSIEVKASTIDKAFAKAVEFDHLIEESISYAYKKGTKYMQSYVKKNPI